MEALLNQMRQAAIQGELGFLTVDLAKALKGKKIQTIYFGYKGQDGVDEFVVGDLKSEYEIAQQQPFQGFASRAEYWESYMTPSKLDRAKNNIVLIAEDGRNTFIKTTSLEIKYDGGAMWCSDQDRFVQYRVVA